MSISGAVGDLFGAMGSFEAASGYSKASKSAYQSADITRASTKIQEQQQDIQTYKVIGAEQASTAGAGFVTTSGSAGDLLRSSAQQAALSRQLIENQGEITAGGFDAQGASYKAQQKAANAQGEGGIIGGVLQAVGWVICTELVKQNRLPRKYWMPGAAVFAAYPDYVREGYYVWAVPSVRHLRDHPRSLYSRFLCAVFNWRAENIAAHAKVRGARVLLRGAMVTAVLWPLCYGIGAVRALLNKSTDWKGLYNGG